MVHLLEEMEHYAQTNNVPIMEKEGIDFLKNIICENRVTNILEIGTAIGYSAIQMCLMNPKIKVVTIERDETRYLEALKNIQKAQMDDRIKVIAADAFDVELKEYFDLIFIDAAKSQYIKFFEKFKVNLAPSGVIVTDNLKFHGLVGHAEEIESKNLRSMVRKIQNYLEFLRSNQDFTTTFYDIGDGVGVSKKTI